MQEARPLSAVTRAGNVMTYPILKTALTAEEIAENDTQTAVKKHNILKESIYYEIRYL